MNQLLSFGIRDIKMEEYLREHQQRIKKFKARLYRGREVHNMKPYQDLLYSLAKFYHFGERITIFEIGVKRGQSTKAFLKGLKDRVKTTEGFDGSGVLYSVDIKKKYQKSIRDEELKKNWVFIEGDSKQIEWDKPIDILFIDGSHTYEGCKADYEKYESFVKEDGLILMHDVLYPQTGVYKVWQEIKHSKFVLSFNRPGLGIIIKDKKYALCLS